MRNRIRKILFVGGTVACAVGLATTAASATALATWTIKPGGSLSGTSSSTTLTDKNTGVKLTCTSSKAVGSLKSGSGQSNPIGKLTSVTFSNCSGAGFTFTVKTTATSTKPWPITATAYNSTTKTTTGNISHIHATLTGVNISCHATVDGTGASANNGKVTITHTNSAANKLKVTGAGNLHVYNVSGLCTGALNNNDATSFVATYTLSKGQTITSP